MTDNQYLLLYTTAPDGEPWSAESDDIADWLETVDPTGIRIFGERLTTPAEARLVTKRAGTVAVSDGPFAEYTEWFVGFDLITAPDVDAATEVGSRHPCARFGRVIVLPLMEPIEGRQKLEETILAREGAAAGA
jgi:hypothetical protein